MRPHCTCRRWPAQRNVGRRHQTEGTPGVTPLFPQLVRAQACRLAASRTDLNAAIDRYVKCIWFLALYTTKCGSTRSLGLLECNDSQQPSELSSPDSERLEVSRIQFFDMSLRSMPATEPSDLSIHRKRSRGLDHPLRNVVAVSNCE